MRSSSLVLNGQPLTLEELADVAYEKTLAVPHPEARPLKPALRVEAAWSQVRSVVARLDRDRSRHPDIANLRAAILRGTLDGWMR